MLTRQNRFSQNRFSGQISKNMAVPPIPKHHDFPKMLDPDETIGMFVASKPYITVPLDCPADTIMTIMCHSGKRVAAIIDDSGILKGFLTRADLFNRMMLPEEENGGPAGLWQGGLWEAGLQDAKLRAAIIKAEKENSDIKALRAVDVMTRNPAFLPSELALKDAMAIMEGHGFQYMPVLGDGAYLLGIADLTEISTAMVQNNRIFDEDDSLAMHLMRVPLYGPAYGARRAVSGLNGF